MNGELARRIGFTIGALLLFRLGTHVPVPGVLTSTLPLTAGVVARLSLFALGLVPYLSAAILIRLLSVVWRGLNALERSGEAGRRSIARLTLALTLVLAAFQAYGIASALKDVPNLVSDPEGWFVVTATATMVGGVFALIFLSEQITRHGIGNGLALVLSVGFLVALPSDVSNVRELVRSGSVSSDLVLFHIVFWVAAVVLIVVVESARRNIGIAFAERSVGARILPARTALLPVKLNNAGFLIPTTVAPWFIFLPLSAAGFLLGGVPWIEALYQSLQVGRPAHLIVISVAVFVLAFVYTSFVVDPERVAEQLAGQGGAIPGIAPGEATADHLDRVVSLTTLVGAVYLTMVQMIPEALLVYGNGLPYSMNGGAALIVVCTILDLQTQVRDVSLTNPGGVRR
ncbi:preprotein translocase subunit SecY [Bradyrhizobium guangdongense]|uniref:Protein translocase subunit SecY n=1 Tax=Bradyrhizobium guangdongense TaxID=1325090 RepID=A0A410V8Z8_9BRAD|nr:preprotein translocase subunit SecY [Bradyrhizobium guangdongense]QAU40171.1 preprotein translocase subunit SecY [Bradyrhizobium guangdongense]QOZ61237.1 preprotein translocase subunit SecY [Bradyrhizobium guangdongense]GGI28420.1 protein translocase subunit SecY [Bradyrhizobium guangdongense]